MNNEPLISKKILYGGSKPVTFKNGMKVTFHFQTRLCNEDKTVIDDSKKMGIGKPMELVLGKKFKLEVWEAIIRKMQLNEVAVFTVNKQLVLQYPLVSKTLRDSYIPVEQRKGHCCAMTVQQEGIGYDDLNQLLKNPQDLEFVIDLLKVEEPEEYEKETWQMNDQEKREQIINLKEKGNLKFKDKNYKEASDCYAQAIGLLEQFMIREKPRDTEWNKLNKQKIPLLLNFSQCKLFEKDYYAVIEHCSTVLDSEPDNVKALYRRAKAHAAIWNVEQAKNDFAKVMKLDSSLTQAVKKELNNLNEVVKKKDEEDKNKFKNMF
ncbi:AH receptor-interacting protein [Agrilus planipennis]|uniref:AH receptor-interacting protein n=1 Tax=Agrilus planipennis TaxID=224129 RepID=A0A1W4WYV9_AGRPL|nr:AH receptor-interacting protein [Agrilus planipennis]